MPVIITIIIAIFFILISWTWNNLGDIDKARKILIIILSLITMFIITFVLFNISKADIKYESQGEMESVRNVLVILFTFLNGLILMPMFSKIGNKVYEKEINKSQASKRGIILLIIFFILMIIECQYLKGIQQDILNIYQKAMIAK